MSFDENYFHLFYFLRLLNDPSALSEALNTHQSASNDQALLLRDRLEEVNRLNSMILETTQALDRARQEQTGLRVALQTAITRRDEMQKSRDAVQTELGHTRAVKEDKVRDLVKVREDRDRKVAELER